MSNVPLLRPKCWAMEAGGFPASVPSRRPICPSKALQCTPSGYPDQWSRAGETSAFVEKPHFNYLKFKMNFLKNHQKGERLWKGLPLR